jgi:hypothetical protein
MKNSAPSDRRQFPRFTIRVPLSLSISAAETEATLNAKSINLSMNGVYCTVNRYLPLFEQILVMFVIPKEIGTPYKLVSKCEGVVVRIEPENEEPGQDEYNIAVYFQNLSQTERIMLHTLISTYSEVT